jgi:hypothetical protein
MTLQYRAAVLHLPIALEDIKDMKDMSDTAAKPFAASLRFT